MAELSSFDYIKMAQALDKSAGDKIIQLHKTNQLAKVIMEKDKHPDLTKKQICSAAGVSPSVIGRLQTDLGMKSSLYRYDVPLPEVKNPMSEEQKAERNAKMAAKLEASGGSRKKNKKKTTAEPPKTAIKMKNKKHLDINATGGDPDNEESVDDLKNQMKILMAKMERKCQVLNSAIKKTDYLYWGLPV